VLIVVSPAKSLDYESPLATRKHSEPAMLDRAADLVGVMAAKSPAELSSLMGISESLAITNFERFQDWERPFTPDNARPAILAFRGDVYLGMDAPDTFTERDYTHAQKTLRILSGLYGVLRPLDLMQAYRLEMGTRLATPAGRDLYAFWGSEITKALNEAIADSPGAKVLVNLASNEYFGAVRTDELAYPVVTPTFLDRKGDDHKVIALHAKRARGAMTGWIIRNRVKSVKGLQDFDGLGYQYAAERSSKHNPVFIRDKA
jgi:cytoplasmic iron level regulating protein YaaA (DUF328/UPF0246 family)